MDEAVKANTEQTALDAYRAFLAKWRLETHGEPEWEKQRDALLGDILIHRQVIARPFRNAEMDKLIAEIVRIRAANVEMWALESLKNPAGGDVWRLQYHRPKTTLEHALEREVLLGELVLDEP